MKIFVISLKGAATRRALATAQLKQYGLEFEFFDAIGTADDPCSYFGEIDSRQFRLNTLRDPLPEEIGCYASHLTLWKACVKLNQPVVILEDDFLLTPDSSSVLALVRALIDDFGFIRLEDFQRKKRFLSSIRPPFYPIFNDRKLRVFYLSDVPLCALAYAISPTAAASLVSASSSLIAPVDKFLQKNWLHRTPIYAVSPTVVCKSSEASTSTIGVRQRKSRDPVLLLRRTLYKAFGEVRKFSFDRKHLNQKMLLNGVEPNKPLKLAVARRELPTVMNGGSDKTR